MSEPGPHFLSDNVQEEKLLALLYLNLQTTIFTFRKCSCATILPSPITEWDLYSVSRDPYFQVFKVVKSNTNHFMILLLASAAQ